MSAVADKLTCYLVSGGLFNPEMHDPQKVRDLLIDARNELQRLEKRCAKLQVMADKYKDLCR